MAMTAGSADSVNCSVSTCRHPATILVQFAFGGRPAAYCDWHDARASPRRRKGWQPWQVDSVERL